MEPVEILLAIEEIKRLKSRYFYYLDHKDWDAWRREVFHPELVFHVEEALSEPVIGIDKFIEWTAYAAADQISVHHGHMPDIEILSPTEAKGIWAMEDTLRLPGKQSPMGYTFLHGYGHYHETYLKGENGWRIKTVRLTRLYLERR